MVLSYRAFLDPFKKLNKNRCYHCILEKPSMWGNPFDLAARTLQTLRSVALVGATTAASGLALFQQLKETQVGHRGCKTRVVRVAKHLVDLRASMKILLCFGWKDDGPLQSWLDSFDSVIFVPTSTKQFVWYNFHHWHPLTTIFLGSFRIHFRKQPVCASFISLTRHSPSMIPGPFFSGPSASVRDIEVLQCSKASNLKPHQRRSVQSASILRDHPSSLETDWTRSLLIARMAQTSIFTRRTKRILPVGLHLHAWMCCWFDITRPPQTSRGHYDGNLFHICLEVFPGIVTTRKA